MKFVKMDPENHKTQKRKREEGKQCWNVYRMKEQREEEEEEEDKQQCNIYRMKEQKNCESGAQEEKFWHKSEGLWQTCRIWEEVSEEIRLSKPPLPILWLPPPVVKMRGGKREKQHVE